MHLCAITSSHSRRQRIGERLGKAGLTARACFRTTRELQVTNRVRNEFPGRGNRLEGLTIIALASKFQDCFHPEDGVTSFGASLVRLTALAKSYRQAIVSLVRHNTAKRIGKIVGTHIANGTTSQKVSLGIENRSA